MNITLRSGERLYLNGAVIRVDRKATIELLNDAAFLLESHVMQAAEATTPLRQIYFAVQIALMDPASKPSVAPLIETLIAQTEAAIKTVQLRAALDAVRALVGRGRHFEALKTLRANYPVEHVEMTPVAVAKRDAA